jgi:hypothetical protein
MTEDVKSILNKRIQTAVEVNVAKASHEGIEAYIGFIR